MNKNKKLIIKELKSIFENVKNTIIYIKNKYIICHLSIYFIFD